MPKNWFRLDNAGRLYASIVNPRDTTLFRLSATLDNVINAEQLSIALHHMIKRFPYFNTHLKKGLFWYYVEESGIDPLPYKENNYPNMNYSFKKKSNFPFRVLYFENRVSVEFTHAITDGTGAFIFLKSLLFEYFRLLGIIGEPDGDILVYGSEVRAEELENSFSKYYIKKVPASRRIKKAFHFPYKVLPKGIYSIVTGIIPSRRIKEVAIGYNATITELLSAIYFKTILDLIEKKGYKKKPVVLNVPVNLRKMYPSGTMRNFFISVTPSLDPRLGSYKFAEIIKYIKYFMEVQVDKKYINQMITRNVKNERNILLRALPIFIKDLIMPWIYHFYGERGFTSGISNLGVIDVPDHMKRKIERFEVYPPPSSGNLIKVTMLGYQSNLYITFGKLTHEKEVEREFFKNLVMMGIPVKIETNVE
ncbi:MAG: hypothetical protein HGA49_03340 [Eubacteriaceae bacterium]|nr:hypothetical protein [Eubacteriaceae bacterium]